MDTCRCTKESELATLISEVASIKTNQSETRDLIIVVTKLVEQFNTTQYDVKIIKEDIKVLKEKPMNVISKIIWLILGVIITIGVNYVMIG